MALASLNPIMQLLKQSQFILSEDNIMYQKCKCCFTVTELRQGQRPTNAMNVQKINAMTHTVRQHQCVVNGQGHCIGIICISRQKMDNRLLSVEATPACAPGHS